MGRAGRFGTKGLALTFVATDEDSEAAEVMGFHGDLCPVRKCYRPCMFHIDVPYVYIYIYIHMYHIYISIYGIHP